MTYSKVSGTKIEVYQMIIENLIWLGKSIKSISISKCQKYLKIKIDDDF